MFLQPYQPHELKFAYCYRVYFRFYTFGKGSCAPLAQLDSVTFDELTRPYSIHVLECRANATSVQTLVSLQPFETISACAGKLKGRLSKWLRQELKLTGPATLLSRGYFACTLGKSRREAVEKYLNEQSEHHGYSKRELPPVFIKTYKLTLADETRLSAKHCEVLAYFHLVMATSHRRCVFGSHQAQRVTSEWRKQQSALGLSIIKVSFVPDHVHVALRLHPAASPITVVAALMNTAQETVQNEMVEAGLQRLWAPSAYLGSYGDFASPQIRKYMEHQAEDPLTVAGWATSGEMVNE